MKHRTIGTVVVGIALFTAGCADTETSKRRLVETGKKYFANGKYKEASLIFRKAIAKDQRYGEAYYELGLTELRLGRYGEALRSLRRASELQPENDDAHARLGDLYLAIYFADRKRNKQFLSDLTDLSDRILKRNPKSFEGLRMRGYVEVAGRQFKEAAEDFKGALAAKPDHPQTSHAYAQALLSSGRAEEAEAFANAFIEKNKTFGPMYDLLYLTRLKDKNVPEAEAVLKRKVANNPKRPDFLLELALHHARAKHPDQMRSTIALLSNNRKDFPNGRQIAGDFYYRLGDLDSAYKEYEASAKEGGDGKLSSERKMVEVLAFQGRDQEATQLAQQLVEQHPNDDAARALRASLRLRGGNAKELDTAVTEFQSVLAKMPDNAVVRYNYAEALLAKGKLGEAKVQLQEAIKLRSRYVPPRIALMRVHLTERDFPKVVALADEVLKEAPRLGEVRILRAAALMGNKDYTGARAELDEALKQYPDSKDARYLLAMLNFSEKRLKDAEDGFKALWESNPPDQRGLFGLVEVHMAGNRAGEARQILEKALASKPANPATIRLAIANVAVRSRQFDDAIVIYKDLAKEMPKSQEMWHRLGETYRRASRFDEAYQAFETGKNIDPQKVRLWLDLAIVLENMNKKDQLRPVYEQILRLDPDNPVALNNLAYMLADDGIELNQALSYAQRAKQKLPNHVDIADTLGWVYIKKNLSDDAIKIFRDLLVRRPEHVTWRYHLAMALVQKGDKLQARKELELALRNKPTKDEETKIRELLSRIG